MVTPILLEIPEAVPLLGKSATADDVRELIDSGEIAVVRIRGKDYVVVNSIVAFARRAEKQARKMARH